jgi:hypothetical protein
MLLLGIAGAGCTANLSKPLRQIEELSLYTKSEYISLGVRMTMTYIATTWSSEIVLALAPMERWAAAKDLGTDGTVPSWLIWSVGVALTVLAGSMLVVTYKQRSRRSRLAGNHSAMPGGEADKDQ